MGGEGDGPGDHGDGPFPETAGLEGVGGVEEAGEGGGYLPVVVQVEVLYGVHGGVLEGGEGDGGAEEVQVD